MTILERYKVNISTPVGDRALITAENMWLAQYINDHYSLSEANRLLQSVNEVLTGVASLGGGATQSLQLANIELPDTKIYKDVDDYFDDETITPDFVLPTADFKVIVEAWRDYLQQ
ncbi:hypothetical protein [Flagellimonas onchidii]|uniref:hypothetical protein n=1 Tax=Flagellimonas onchidii TaxID=2562684 RepID=UPI0010A64153|nr:hypothetical protein [Allomuricauda onchidii]